MIEQAWKFQMFANINGYIVVFITEQVSFLSAYVGPALMVDY
jgi:hypothetical protein